MNSKIYVYDNYTGFDIPRTIDNYPVELLLGESIDMIHNRIPNKSLMFCVFTSLQDADIIVRSEEEKNILLDLISFGCYDIKVEVRENSIWYSSNTSINIIISGSVHIESQKLSTLLGMFIDKIKHKKEDSKVKEKAEVYTVFNKRNSKILMKTPVYSIAVELCDKNPCCVVMKSNGEIIYLSGHGKVPISYEKGTHTKQHKATLQKINAGIFKVNIK